MLKYLLALSLFSCVSFAKDLKPKTIAELRDSAVMIVNLQMNSGGTGSVLSSGKDGSQILTNKHVCEVIENGGYVIKDDAQHLILSYQADTQHDLCVIRVKKSFGINLSIAKQKANPADLVRVSGHPTLLPHIATTGHMTDEVVIQLVVGIRECQQEDMEEHAFECIFMGGVLILQDFDSVVVSNLISPGSSGSAVFNKSGEIVGVVFAGMGGLLSHGFIVPQRYVQSFVKRLDNSLFVKPVPKKSKEQEEEIFDFKKCDTLDAIINTKIRNICKSIKDPMIWRK